MGWVFLGDSMNWLFGVFSKEECLLKAFAHQYAISTMTHSGTMFYGVSILKYVYILLMGIPT